MPRRFNPNLYPPGGYRFTERDGVVIRGDSWRSLQASVEDYRRRNGIEVGDVWAEIQAQVCGGSPGFCGESEGTPKEKSGDETSFNHRVVAWLAWALGRKRLNAWKRVDAAEVNRRAAICALCPKQRALSRACEACIETVNSCRKALLDNEAPAYQNLHPCSVLNEDCVSSVHVELTPSNNPELPNSCWRRA